MAHFTCNFISYVLNRAVDVDVIIPGVTSTEAGEPGVTHKPRWKYPVLYLLHGYCNDYSTWERYTSIERYAEERRIAVVTFSAENNMYMKLQDVKKENPIEGLMEPDYEKFLMEELPDFVTSMFPISEKLGVGNCTSGFDFCVKGCPPTETEIYEALKRYIVPDTLMQEKRY